FAPQADDVEMPRRLAVRECDGCLDLRKPGERARVPRGDFPAPDDLVAETLELREPERRLEVAQPVIEAERGHLVAPILTVLLLARDAVVAEHPDASRERRVVRGHDAALAGRHELDRVQAERCQPRAGSDRTHPVPGAEGMRRVL